MAYPPLDVLDGLAGRALIPGAVQLFCDGAELNDKVVGKVGWIDLSALLAPETKEVRIVIAQDDTGVRAADEMTPVVGIEFENLKPGRFGAIGLNSSAALIAALP